MKDAVVSDSTCLIGLERIERLDILRDSFANVWIPPEVSREFGQTLPWLRVRAPHDQQTVAAWQEIVDIGEAAAIALAKELGCEVILDDWQARRLAAREGVPCLGVLGLFLRAKRDGRLSAVRPLIEALQQKRFFLSQELVAEALRLADER